MGSLFTYSFSTFFFVISFSLVNSTCATGNFRHAHSLIQLERWTHVLYFFFTRSVHRKQFHSVSHSRKHHDSDKSLFADSINFVAFHILYIIRCKNSLLLPQHLTNSLCSLDQRNIFLNSTCLTSLV